MTDKKKVKSIWELELHETVFFNLIEVMRIPGGWIYTYFDSATGQEATTSVFIPFSIEFKND